MRKTGAATCGMVLILALALAASAAGAATVTFRHAAPGAKHVYLAGTFNNWSDSATPMIDPEQDGVWETTLELAAGTYQYKYVVDGSWQYDKTNPETVDDGFGGNNSVLNVTDPEANIVLGESTAAPAGGQPAKPAAGGTASVTFSYAPGRAVQAVFLAGEFNGWSPEGARLTDPDGDGVYTVTIPLAPGRYQYKFVVDGQWVQDPDNPEGTDDGFGGQNSVVNVPAGVTGVKAGGGQPAVSAAESPAPQPAAGEVLVTFAYSPSGKPSAVYLAGEFNGWNATGEKMTDPDGDGVYTVTIPLAPGRYQYKFVVDGQWHQDPNNPEETDDGFGGHNSVVIVPAGVEKIDASSSGRAESEQGGGQATGETVGMRSVEFHYTPVISGVTNVFLAGTFNDWNDSATRMTDTDGDGTYTVTLLLAPGTYQYKFVVDGQWHQDPDNPQGTDDGYGGQNSVLKVDASFQSVDIEPGDGRIYTADIEPIFDYATCNPLTPTEIAITAKAHFDDVQAVELVYQVNDGAAVTAPMGPAQHDPAFQYYTTRVALGDKDDTLDYVIRYRDADTVVYLGAAGTRETRPEQPFHYSAATHPPFLTPDWAQAGVIYQIFPERFRNGDPGNDPDFHEVWYQGVDKLPAGGKTNGEYFHLVKDWYDIAGLVHSPYRTDGKPDYYSFYGGDIAGVRQKLDYLNDLGITVIYFNPLNQGMSNHKYDPVDYLKIDPHFASEDEFIAFVQDAHAHGIRIVVDMAFNHTGNWHFAFRDAVEKGPASPYYDWYEFHRWPLPDTRDFKASDYYDCWWGFGLHPNLNYDLSRPNADENAVEDMADAQPNMPVVEYVLSVADYWLGKLDIDGFRLDVPNEVPFWFWKLFHDRCHAVKADCYLVGELWGNAGRWIGPACFDATMNYKFFRDPVMDYIGQGQLDAAAFDLRLAPGRFQYPPQAVGVMMNLIDSHDTVRFLTATQDVRRLMLAALFSMSYVGMPTIWYGDEVGMQGGKDPDCRRPFDWRYEGDPRKVALRDFYGRITRFRRDHAVLADGDFNTLLTEGMVYGFARTLDRQLAVALFNAGPTPATITLKSEDLRVLLPDGAPLRCQVVVGPERFPQAGGASLKEGDTVDLGSGEVNVTLPGLSGTWLCNAP